MSSLHEFAERNNDSGSHALLAWFFIVMIALALSCCCRCIHSQLCCGCCNDSRTSNRRHDGIELESIGGERPSAAPENSDSSTSSKQYEYSNCTKIVAYLS